MSVHPSRQAYVEDDGDDDKGLISLSEVPLDTDYELPSTGGNGIAPQKAAAILAQFERKKAANAIAVPTDDKQVRTRLRGLGEPITLFGEDAADRRARLRQLLLAQGEDGDVEMVDAGDEGQDEQEEEFYSEASAELLDARRKIARFSLPRAKDRVALQKLDSGIPLRIHKGFRKEVKERLAGFDLQGSQIAGDRPVSISRFSPSGQMVAAGNWGGGIKLLDVPNLEEKANLRGHNDLVGGISWFPGSTLHDGNVSASSVNLASGGGEGDINLWSLESESPLATLQGHSGRVCRVEFHPSGDYLASASFDTTWRLWDVRTTTELQLQEGHSREAFAVSFNSDGSLLASAGLDSIGRIWDLRTGRTVMILDGHIKEIYALDWGVDGYRVLTGSADGWIKCWDLRNVRNAGGMGAHKSVVSDLRWFKGQGGSDPLSAGTRNGETKEVTMSGDGVDESKAVTTPRQPQKAGTFLVSSGYDREVNIFSADDWSLVKTLSGHSGNVMSCDVSRDGKWIVSSGRDRTVKLWGRDDGLTV